MSQAEKQPLLASHDQITKEHLMFFFKKNKNWIDFVSCARAGLVGNIGKFPEKSAIQTEISPIFCLQPCFGDFFADFNRNLAKFLPSTFRLPLSYRWPPKPEISAKFPRKKWTLSSLLIYIGYSLQIKWHVRLVSCLLHS